MHNELTYDNNADADVGNEREAKVLQGLQDGSMSLGKVDSELKGDCDAAVRVRRQALLPATSPIPYHSFNYAQVVGVCCENIVGYIPIPLGVAGPLLLDGNDHWIPMATTEGALVASTSRGCKATREGGNGVSTAVLGHQMTRGPVLRAPSIQQAARVKVWVDQFGLARLRPAFDSTSRHVCLKTLKVSLAGPYIFIRFGADTAEAMGMNMVSKATEAALQVLLQEFPECRLVSLSGNYCMDKKAGQLNWIEGRGWSVLSEAFISEGACRNVLKCDPLGLVELAVAKNYIGSAMAGASGGSQNAQAANVVAAVFLATGQDMAQVVDSSACLTTVEWDPVGRALHVTCTMPCIEVGTIGGGTRLEAQKGALQLGLGREPTSEALARLICGSVLVAEVSLLAALQSGSLVSSHLALNRPH